MNSSHAEGASRRMRTLLAAAALIGSSIVSAGVAEAAVEPHYVSLDAPARLVDTRPGETTIDGRHAGTGLIPGGASLQLQVSGRAGIPTDAHAVVLNVTAVTPLAPGHLTIHPTGTPRPTASNLNYDTGDVIANTVIARLGAGGDICAFTHSTAHLVVDVAGFLIGPEPPPAGPTCPPLAYGDPQPLGTPRPIGNGPVATDINNAGVMVGTDYHGSAAFSDAMWWPTPDGSPQLVPGVPDARSSSSVAVNNRNQVLVSAYSDATGPHLLVIDLPTGNGVEFPGLDRVAGIDPLQVSEVAPVTLNDRGEVLLNLLHGEHGAPLAIAVWNSTAGVVETHPQLTSDTDASQINHLGHVVGHRAGTNTGDAFYWDRDTDVVHLLDRGGFTIADATGVNDAGQIVGVVFDGQTQHRAAYWPDRNSAPTLVPGISGWVAEINAAGVVLDKGLEDGVWDSASGRWVDFPAAPGQGANAINDLGVVVGGYGDGRIAIWRPL